MKTKKTKKKSTASAPKKSASGIRDVLAENAAKHRGVANFGARRPGTRAL